MGRRAPALRPARVLEARGRGGSSKGLRGGPGGGTVRTRPCGCRRPRGRRHCTGTGLGRPRTSHSVRASQSARLRPFAPRRLASVYENSTWLHNWSRDLTPESGLCLPHPNRVHPSRPLAVTLPQTGGGRQHSGREKALPSGTPHR